MKFRLFIHDSLRAAFLKSAEQHQIKVEHDKSRKESGGRFYEVCSVYNGDDVAKVFYFGMEFGRRSDEILKSLIIKHAK